MTSSSSLSPAKYWLLKAEPDSRIVKGKEVKFSVDDFEKVGTSPWEGVRNYEARNLMREMRVGERALFYHSNCKNPGIAGFAEVAKEAYPDYTAWDASHPYYDPKSKESEPKWFMVDLKFSTRAKHFVPLALLRLIADSSEPPDEVEYIGSEGVQAIKSMDLVTRGRLSVQRVQEKAWDVMWELAERGGWEEVDLKAKGKKTAGGKAAAKPKAPSKKTKKEVEEEDEDSEEEVEEKKPIKVAAATSRKRKTRDEVDVPADPPRRSTRARK
ncbi:PUA-like domain-containing protein [Cyathus striatus]|nr:PUA-like domain-containing protein [Cyathus striatus]